MNNADERDYAEEQFNQRILDDEVDEPEHEHYTVDHTFGRPQAIWSTADECVLCGSGRPRY